MRLHFGASALACALLILGLTPVCTAASPPHRQAGGGGTPVPVRGAQGVVSGTVLSAGVPVSGATVSLAGTSFSATTDANGAYAFSGVPAGTQTVNVASIWHQPAASSANVARGGGATVNFSLTPLSVIPWNGTSSYLLGANYAWFNYGTDFGTGGWGKYTDWTQVATDFATLHNQGVHIARWWVFGDGRYSPEFNGDGTISGLDSNVLPNIDQALQLAAANHITLLLTLIDGGMLDNAQNVNGVVLGGHVGIITSPTIQQSYLDNALKPFLQHIAASPYKNYVLAYDVFNEPESNIAADWGGQNLAASQIQAFVVQCANYVHAYGGGVYATVGSATPYYLSTWKGLGLDFYQVHYYPWMDNGGAAGSGLPTFASLNLDRPCILGEFPTVDSSYGANDTAALTAKWYLDAAYAKGYAGALGWSYSAGDDASNWTSFQPIFTTWSQAHNALIGPQ